MGDSTTPMTRSAQWSAKRFLSSSSACHPTGAVRSMSTFCALFVHLDDPNPEIQEGIYGVLQAAVHQDYVTFAAEAKTAVAKSAHPRQCEELLRLAQSLQQAQLDA